MTAFETPKLLVNEPVTASETPKLLFNEAVTASETHKLMVGELVTASKQSIKKITRMKKILCIER